MRIRPRFSLRTLFIVLTLVSLPLAWVAYQLSWMRQRQAFLADQSSRYGDNGMTWSTGFNDAQAPGALKWFGDVAVNFMCLVIEVDRIDTTRDLGSYDVVRQARKLFPEAEVVAEVIDKSGTRIRLQPSFSSAAP